MRLMFDTNVIVDILLKREPHYADSYLAVLNCIENGDWCSFPVSATADIYYLIKDLDQPKEQMRYLGNVFNEISDVLGRDYEEALNSPMKDFENALIATVARRQRADYIITRNTRDYIMSPVQAITPADFNRM